MKSLLQKMLRLPITSFFIGMPQEEMMRQVQMRNQVARLLRERGIFQQTLPHLRAMNRIDEQGLGRYSHEELAETAAYTDADRIDASGSDEVLEDITRTP